MSISRLAERVGRPVRIAILAVVVLSISAGAVFMLWRAQIIRTAKEADFYTNITGGTWWTSLRLMVLGQRLRYVVVLQKVGHGETGVLAMTIFAEAVTDTPSIDPAAPQATFMSLLKTSDAESVTLVYSDDIDQRWDEVQGTIGRTLAATVAAFASGLT